MACESSTDWLRKRGMGKSKCEHGRQRNRCKDCGGSSICEHGRQRYRCKDCGGVGICEHMRGTNERVF